MIIVIYRFLSSLPNELTIIISSVFSLFHFLSLLLFFLFVCVCLFVCVAGIGLGSSPTSSQNEALPPSTDWPVSAYTSSFSLSSPEMDDAGTWFIHNLPLPHYSGWITANSIILPSCCCNTQSLNHSLENNISPVSFKSLLLIEYDLHLSSSLSTLYLMQCIFPLWCRCISLCVADRGDCSLFYSLLWLTETLTH